MDEAKKALKKLDRHMKDLDGQLKGIGEKQEKELKKFQKKARKL
jgi:hypothetical protein